MPFIWTFISVVFTTNYVLGNVNVSLRIMVLLPERKGSFYYPFGMERAGAAVSIALDHLKSQEILSGVDLQVDYVNTKCNDVYALGTTSDKIHQNTYTAIIGPQCSHVCSNVGRLASFYNIPCFSGLCQDTEMLNKSRSFHTLTRFLGTFDKVGLGVHGLMKAFGWNRIGVIVQSHTDRIWLYTGDAINEIIPTKGGMVAASKIYDAEKNITIKSILKEVAEVSRVIVLAVRGETLRELMLNAYEMGMTNGIYMFICIYYYLQKNTFGDISWKRNDNLDKKAKKAYESILFMAYYTPPVSQFYEFASQVKNRSQDLFNYQYDSDEEVPYPAVSLYDATYLYGKSVNETLENGEDHMNGTLISTRIWGRTFSGITGNITLNKNGDREQGYKIEQITSADDRFNLQVVGFFFSNVGYFQYNDGNSITWPGGVGPIPDHPACGYKGEYCAFGLSDTERLQLVIGSLVGVLVLLLSLSIIVPRLVVRRAKARASQMLWRIRENELTFNNRSMRSMSKISLRSGSSQQNSHGVITAYYKGVLVCVKKFKNVEHRVDFQELRQLKELEHTNIVKTMGFCVDAPLFFVVTEYCSKGSLMDILENDDINLDMDFKYCLLWDIMRGLEYIFGSSIGYHGNLKSSNCMVDSRFVVKLKDFGPHGWLSLKERFASDYLWTAPELLRLPKHSSSIVMVATKFISPLAATNADIYSLGIIMHEISERQGPCGIEVLGMTPTEVVDSIQRDTVPVFRPKFEETPPKLQAIIEKCWDEEPSNRPSLKSIIKEINSFTSSKQKVDNFFDNLLKRMEQYATNLEDLVEERTSKYFHEKQKAEDLLHRLLPQSIAQQIQSQGYVDPEHYDCVTIMFTDIVQFTSLSAESTPLQIVEMLNSLYSQFDDAINEFDVYKVETIGDAYMCVSGLPTCNDYHHLEICRLAKQMMRISERFTVPHKPDMKIQIRAGIHSGPCVAGVIGVKMPRYCLFGDTVNTASRMESNGEGSKIHVSEQTFQMLTTDLSFTFEARGNIYIKGKGYMSTYWLEWQDNLRCPSFAYDLAFG